MIGNSPDVLNFNRLSICNLRSDTWIVGGMTLMVSSTFTLISQCPLFIAFNKITSPHGYNCFDDSNHEYFLC